MPGISLWHSWGVRFGILECRYSIGDDIPELADEYASLVAELPELEALNSRRKGDLFVTLCSWAVLLDDHTSAATLGALLERDTGFWGTKRFLLNSLGLESDAPDEFPVDDYWIGHAQHAVNTGDHNEARKILYEFVNHQWFQQTYNSGLRVITHTGEKHGHVGYWCYEGAAVAKILDIDDTRLNNHKYYPWDLAHPPDS